MNPQALEPEFHEALHTVACHAWRCDYRTCQRHAPFIEGVEDVMAHGKGQYVYVFLLKMKDGRWAYVRAKPGDWEWGPGQIEYASAERLLSKRFGPQGEDREALRKSLGPLFEEDSQATLLVDD
jgi:hypothetical protein